MDTLVNTFLSFTRPFISPSSSSSSSSSSSWNTIYSTTSPCSFTIHQDPASPLRFLISARLPNLRAAHTFDLVADATRRLEWDAMTDSVHMIERRDPWTRILYLATKPVWPTAARDLCTISHIRTYTLGHDRLGLLNVTQSILHDQCPPGKDGRVRMWAGVAGQWVEEHKVESDTGVTWETRLVQLVDGDPKGWIPNSVVSYGKCVVLLFLFFLLIFSCLYFLL